MSRIGIFCDTFIASVGFGYEPHEPQPINNSINSLITLSLDNELLFFNFGDHRWNQSIRAFLCEYTIGHISDPQKWLLVDDINKILLNIRTLSANYIISSDHKLDSHLLGIEELENIIHIGDPPKIKTDPKIDYVSNWEGAINSIPSKILGSANFT